MCGLWSRLSWFPSWGSSGSRDPANRCTRASRPVIGAKSLKDPDPALRREAITALGALKVREFAPTSLQRQGTGTRRRAAKAAEALWSLGAQSDEAVAGFCLC